MTTNNSSTIGTQSTTSKDFVFMIFVGVVLGVLGELLNEAVLSIIGASILLGLFGSFNSVINRNRGIVSGLIAGGLVGLIVGTIGYLLGDIASTIIDAALFGFVRGLLVGAIIGFITRAKPDENDEASIAIFLTSGSIVVGAFLGAGVGIVVGIVIGLFQQGWWGILFAVALGVIVGWYMGAYFKSRRAKTIGAISFGLAAFLSTFVKGAIAGLVLGTISGALTPMILVSAISAYGGLSSRGIKAMFIEAAEAPAEMVVQGAVPFLAPSILVGVIVGTSTAGTDGIVVLAVSMAIIGMLLGVISGIEQRSALANKMTIRQLIEMVILGSDEWPINQVIDMLSKENRKTAVRGAGIGLLIGVIAAAIGAYLSLQIAVLWEQFIVS